MTSPQLRSAQERARQATAEVDQLRAEIAALRAELDQLPRCKTVIRDWRGDVIAPCMHHRKHSGECEV